MGIPTGTFSMQWSETAASRIGDVMAAIVQDQPFSSISQYIEPSDLSLVQQEFNQMQQQFQAQDVPAGIHWKVVGMTNSLTEADQYPSQNNGAAYIVEPILDVQSIDTATGNPVTLSTLPKSPKFEGPAPESSVLNLNIPIGINQDGLIADIDNGAYRFYGMYVSQSQANDPALSVAYGSGTTMGYADLGSAIAVSGN